MDVNIMPADLKTVKLQVRKKGGIRRCSITFPPEIIDRYDLKDKERIVIAYVCRSTEDCGDKKTINGNIANVTL